MTNQEIEDLIKKIQVKTQENKQDPVKAREFLQAIGVYDIYGNLTKEYRE